jgi:hypothetical protein
MIVENDFVAESAAGTVEVVERYRGDQVVLRADIMLTAADGRTVRLRGDIRVTRRALHTSLQLTRAVADYGVPGLPPP